MSTDSSPLQPVFSYFHPAYQFLQLVLLLHVHCTPPVSPACFSSVPLSSPPTQRPTEKKYPHTRTPKNNHKNKYPLKHHSSTKTHPHTHLSIYPSSTYFSPFHTFLSVSLSPSSVTTSFSSLQFICLYTVRLHQHTQLSLQTIHFQTIRLSSIPISSHPSIPSLLWHER